MSVQKEVDSMKRMKQRIITLFMLVFLGCLFLGGCGATEVKEQKNETDKKSDKNENDTYIKNTYGFAEDLLYGEYTAIVSKDGNRSSVKKTTSFKQGTNGGAVFYKTLQNNNESKEYMCVYLEDGAATNNEISLQCQNDIIYKTGNSKHHTITLATPHMKSRCYCMVKDHYLIVAELSEQNEGWRDGYYYLAYKEDADSLSDCLYEEKVSVYDLKDDFNEKMTVTREIKPSKESETKTCVISEGDKNVAYASGYSSYSYDSAELVSTEQEFCDRANNELSKYSVDGLKFTRTSWENRWYRLEVDETGITKENMVKVDFQCTPGQIDGDKVTSDITIKVNAEKEQHGTLAEEEEDTPVDYNSNKNDVSDSNQKKEINISGTWLASDEKYVYQFKYQEASLAIDYSGISAADGKFSYVDTKRGRKRIDGTFVFSGNNKIIATENMSNGKRITFTIEGDKLVSDEITLNRVLDEVVTQFEGSWKKSDETIIFDSDGTFKKKNKDNTWGYYYVLSTSKVMLSEMSRNFRVVDYSISGNNMVLDDKNFTRTSAGSDADALLSFKKTIIGTWRDSFKREYRFSSGGTWEKYSVYYDGDKLISETFLESGTYKLLNDKMIEIDQKGGMTFNRLSYDASTGILSGDGISLEKAK